ncbi:MAG: reverse transcriptase family protein [Planctomycetes bacterium]|nr:reverse transcriptase family protein [Planctomycetota bacterium]
MCLVFLAAAVGLVYAGYYFLGGWGVAAAIIVGLPVLFHFYEIYGRRTNDRPWQWFRARMGWGLGVEELARRLNLGAADLRGFQPRYREVLIPKKRGGQRRLLVPDEATKALQRCILRRLLAKLRVHPAAYGFVKGRSSIDNACKHAGQALVLTMDVIDFFSNTRAERIEAHLRRVGWNAEAAALLTRLMTHDGGLPQGAPTSPALSNIVNFTLDHRLARFVERHGGVYTRYADDLAISFPLDYSRKARGALQEAKQALRSKGYRYHKLKKLRIRRQHQRQVVTGLVVNAKANLPRTTRRWLRAVAHRLASGKQATLTPEQLQGWLAYRHAVENRSKAAETPPFEAAKSRAVVMRRKQYDPNRRKTGGTQD